MVLPPAFFEERAHDASTSRAAAAEGGNELSVSAKSSRYRSPQQTAVTSPLSRWFMPTSGGPASSFPMAGGPASSISLGGGPALSFSLGGGREMKKEEI